MLSVLCNCWHGCYGSGAFCPPGSKRVRGRGASRPPWSAAVTLYVHVAREPFARSCFYDGKGVCSACATSAPLMCALGVSRRRQAFHVSIFKWQLRHASPLRRARRSDAASVQSRVRILQAPITPLNVQAKIDTILALFYELPEVGAVVIKTLQKRAAAELPLRHGKARQLRR